MTVDNEKLDNPGITLYLNFMKYIGILMLVLSVVLVYPIQSLLIEREWGKTPVMELNWLKLDKLRETGKFVPKVKITSQHEGKEGIVEEKQIEEGKENENGESTTESTSDSTTN